MISVNRLDSELQGFQKSLEGEMIVKQYEYSIDELRNKNGIWDEWEKFPGVYYFVEQETIVYVGRALLSQGLGSRVYDQINAFDDPNWDRVIKNGQVIVGVLCFNNEKWHLASALEAYLIDKLKPEFNKRIQ